jgi:hypothetical protein
MVCSLRQEINDTEGPAIKRRENKRNTGQCNITLSLGINGGVSEVALWSTGRGQMVEGGRRKGDEGEGKTPRTITALVSLLAGAREGYRTTAMLAGCDK